MKWYFRDGTVAVDMQNDPDWLEKMRDVEEKLADPKYKRVAEDIVGPYWISTVWLGLDHSFSGTVPLIFETMVFDQSGDNLYSDLDCERYFTEDEALKGHKRMVKKWSKKI